MSTQYETGEGYNAYQAQIQQGAAAQPGHNAFIAAYQARTQALANSLTHPLAQSGTGPAFPSVGINVANNGNTIFDNNPQRYME